MTLIEVIDAARGLAGEPLSATRTFPDNTSSFWQDSTLIEYTKIVQQEIAQEIIQANEDFFTTNSDLSITDGCAAYSLPAGLVNVRRVEDIRGSDPLEIYPVTMNNRGDIAQARNGSQTYTNQNYYLRGSEIVFTNTPSFNNTASYRMWYAKTPDDMSAGSTISQIPPEHHRIMVYGLLGLMQTEQQGDSKMADAKYERSLKKMIKQIENRQTQRSKTVKRSGRSPY